MAIGSNPEIGSRFGLQRDMTPEQLQEWFDYIKKAWAGNLLNGYATVITWEEMKKAQRDKLK